MEDYHDRYRITTPDGIELDLQLAGLGSRFSAAAIDFLFKGLILIALVIVLLLAGGPAEALIIVASFLVYFGYDIVFEVGARGQTPGKKATGLRVLRRSGAPVDLPASAVRNLLRLIDGLPLSYLPGMISILVTRNHQRLGDLAAGTIVVRERGGETKVAVPEPQLHPARVAAPAGFGAAADVAAVSSEELTAVRDFLARRHGLPQHIRADIAQRMADGLRPRVVGADEAATPERFLETLSEAAAGR